MPTELYENLQAPKKAVLAAVDTGAYDVEVSLAELRELAKTAGYPVVGEAVQKLQTPVAATFMGSGRLLELKDYMAAVEGELIIFDEELSPAQLRNIEELCDCPVLDRTMLILDIFAARAVSGEGKLQVELAQYQYYLPRLTTWNEEMGRLGGGIGTRGPGETQLETDKRHIRARISKLQSEHLRIRINGQTVEGEYIFGIVASSSSLAGAMDFFGQKVVADDGLFEVLLLRRPTSPAELQSTIAALSSQELNNELITFCRTDKIELECMKKLNWALDGEKCVGELHHEVEMLPRRIRIVY